jgi:3-oxoacyl-[acyl-carrier protein] reductase
MAARRIRVNAIAPGPIRTAMWTEVGNARGASAGVSASEYEAQVVASMPLGRLGEPQDVADLACFLLGPASGFITGQVIGVDGGFMLAHR